MKTHTSCAMKLCNTLACFVWLSFRVEKTGSCREMEEGSEGRVESEKVRESRKSHRRMESEETKGYTHKHT